jgi:FdhD protein
VLLIERVGGPQTAGGARTRAVEATREVPADISLRLLVNGAPLLSIVCLNDRCDELALGFLFTEGLIDSLDEVLAITFHEELYTVEIRLDHELDRELLESTRSMTSGCGRGVTYVDPRLDGVFRRVGRSAVLEAAELWNGIGAFNRASELYRAVGGVHSALFQGPQGSVMAEDVGRHNCLDRIAGALLRRQGPGGGRGGAAPGAGGQILSSGRVSTEIITKCVRLGVEIIISRSAPTTSALRLAQDFDLTVIGYAKAGRAVLYTGAERLRL